MSIRRWVSHLSGTLKTARGRQRARFEAAYAANDPYRRTAVAGQVQPDRPVHPPQRPAGSKPPTHGGPDLPTWARDHFAKNRSHEVVESLTDPGTCRTCGDRSPAYELRLNPQHRVRIIGGPYDGWAVYVTDTPPDIEILGCRYRRIDDPETGEFLGTYAIVEPGPRGRSGA